MRPVHSQKLSASPALLAALGLLLSACGGTESPADGAKAPPGFTLQFAPMVGDKPFSCASTYDNLGTTPSKAVPMDFRMYVHGFSLLRKNGEKVPLTLVEDGKWQHEGVAFLDFEDNTHECKTGSPETRAVVEGDAPAHDDYTGVEFALGVPTALNHIDAATAAPPMNLPGMWWDWAGGYRWTRIEVQTEKNPVYYFHLGAMGCTGTPVKGIACNHNNETVISLKDFDLKAGKVMIDLAALFKENDLNQVPDMKTDFLAGCMSFTPDPECTPMFKNIGLAFDSDEKMPEAQTVFRAQ